MRCERLRSEIGDGLSSLVDLAEVDIRFARDVAALVEQLDLATTVTLSELAMRAHAVVDAAADSADRIAGCFHAVVRRRLHAAIDRGIIGRSRHLRC
jgi:hypothetical protein